MQVQALEKEADRIHRIRSRNQERLKRFLNSRQRTIGLDLDALNSQIDEKRRLKDAEKQADLLEAARLREITRILEGQEYQERLARQAATEAFKAEWEQQKAALQERKKKQLDFGDAPEKCGMASLQSLAGEDSSFGQRRRLQSDQMKTWVLQQVEEKRVRGLVQSAEERKYADFVKQVSELSEAEQKAEEEARKALSRAIQQQNCAAAQHKAEARATEASKKLEEDRLLLERVARDRLLNEANDFELPGTSKVRRDHFRGYTSAQRNQILDENLALIQERADKRQADKWGERLWAAQQDAWRRRIEEQEWLEKAQRKQLAKDQQEALLQQREEQSARVKASKQAAFGEIGDGFYNKFGTSVR